MNLPDVKGTITLTEKLRCGNGCTLWRGRGADQCPVVAKIYPDTKGAESAFRREVSILKTVRHENIVRYLGSGPFENTHVILLKDGGENLYDHVRNQKPLTESTIRPIAKAMCASLAHCHKQSICHGDVKLDNFVINAKGRVRLLDFGLSEVIPAGKTSMLSCGSTFHRPPEALHPMPHDLKLDVWALGISLFMLGTHALPFPDTDDYENFTAVLFEEPDLTPLKEKCADSFVELIGTMLQKDPKERPTVEQCLQSPWFNEKPA